MSGALLRRRIRPPSPLDPSLAARADATPFTKGLASVTSLAEKYLLRRTFSHPHSAGSRDPSRFLGEEARHLGAVVDEPAGAEGVEQLGPVRARVQARVEDRRDAPIGVAAHESPEPLPQLERRHGQGVVAEPVAALLHD